MIWKILNNVSTIIYFLCYELLIINIKAVFLRNVFRKIWNNLNIIWLLYFSLLQLTQQFTDVVLNLRLTKYDISVAAFKCSFSHPTHISYTLLSHFAFRHLISTLVPLIYLPRTIFHAYLCHITKLLIDPPYYPLLSHLLAPQVRRGYMLIYFTVDRKKQKQFHVFFYFSNSNSRS